MSRLGIFAFYDRDGIADDYVYHLLDSMGGILEEMIIVVNGYVQSNCLERFYEYTDDIVLKENIGYDAGAYKEIILAMAENNELNRWDEIVLFNDTFYGPFFDWQIIFEEMKEKDVDFWGLSKWLRGKAEWFGGELPEHLQSYFLVIRRNMLTSETFKKFWYNLEHLSGYQDVICRFEVMFTVHHSRQGFKYASWLDGDDRYTKSGETVYCAYPYDLIKDCRFPILKRKAITVTDFVQAGAALYYIERHYKYNTKMIWDHIMRKEKEEPVSPFTFREMEQFASSHKEIYIYGYGKWGHAVESLFSYKGWTISGIIDSNETIQNAFVRKLQDFQIGEKDGIVVALGAEWISEVYPMLNEMFEENQLLLPSIT